MSRPQRSRRRRKPSRQARKCPDCGKPMAESPGFAGLWLCPDAVTAINDAPPYQYKCRGMHLTKAGAAAFEVELLRQYAARN